ncbi:MAG: hypothetical protein ACREVA_00160 [Burkholderiales bacterium]
MTGRIDMSALMRDPLFVEPITMRRRTVAINAFGEPVFKDDENEILASIQGLGQEHIEFVPQGARLSDLIGVYSAEHLTAKSPAGATTASSAGRRTGYPDIIVWQGQDYEVVDRLNHLDQGGYNMAVCRRLKVSA